ncbi:MAG: DUF6968 family protein [Candidatus Acidiferrales bacterium]
MDLQDVGEVIATRKLYVYEAADRRREIVVKLGRPQPFPDDAYDNWYCPFQVVGIGSEQVRYAGGVDAFQALQLVMRGVGIYLSSLNEEQGGRLRWLDDEGTDLGFPSS